MASNRKYRIGELLVAIATLLFVNVSPVFASATQVAPATISSSGLMAGLPNIFPNTTQECSVRLYNALYPATSTAFGTSIQQCSSPHAASGYQIGFYREDFSIDAYWNLQIGGTPADGDYWIEIRIDGIPEYYVKLAKTSGVWSFDPAPFIPELTPNFQYKTRFISSVASGSASSTVFDTSFFIDTNEFSTSNRPDTISYTISSDSSTQVASAKKLNLPITAGTSTKTVTILPSDYTGVLAGESFLPDDTYTMWVKFWNFSANTFVLPAEITINFTISGGVVTTSNVVSQSEGLFPEDTILQECSITNITGCISNAFAFLFFPSSAALDRVTELNNDLSVKFPFVYVYQFAGISDAIFNTEPTAETSMVIHIWDQPLTLVSPDMIAEFPFVNTIRDLIGSAILILTAVYLYRRTLKIFNQNPV